MAQDSTLSQGESRPTAADTQLEQALQRQSWLSKLWWPISA